MKTEITDRDIKRIENELLMLNSGNSWVLMVEQGRDRVIFPRDSLPCLGGEMRKYKKTHGEKYTDPYTGNKNNPTDTYRPGDLHWPFPEGTPIALAVRRDVSKQYETLLEAMFSDESPWKRGFKDTSSVHFFKKEDKIKGYLLKDTEVDPTVMINLFNVFKSSPPTLVQRFDLLKKKGLTVREALAGALEIKPGFQIANFMKGYYTPNNLDIYRHETQNPRDLNGSWPELETGRTFKGRYDYNRKRFHEVFEVKDGKNFTFLNKARELAGMHPVMNIWDSSQPKEIPIEEEVEIIREAYWSVFDEHKALFESRKEKGLRDAEY